VDPVSLGAALALGLAAGGGLAALYMKARAAAASERLRGALEQAALLRLELDNARDTASETADLLRRETARRAGAEEQASRVPALEAELARAGAEASALRVRAGDLAARMEAERKAAAEREALLKDLQAQLQDNFKALSADALASNNQNFLQLAAQHLAKVQEAGRGDLELRQKSIEGLVKPIRDTLAQVDGQIRTLEKQRVEAYAGLTEQVRRMTAEQGDLRRETGRLVTALRKPTVRGRWGEIQLKRVVELAGMLNHCDFVEQASVSTEEGKLRPDMVVRLPGGRNVVVDSKAPLEAYLDAQDATDEDVRRQRMDAHAGAIREHMTKLGQKSYWEHLSPTPEFVVMFLPSEIFFSAALEQAPRLIEEGVGKGVIVASPTTLIALLRAVAYGWRQEQTAENAQKIAELGRELHKRVATLAEHFGKVGKGLGAAVDAYNGAVNSFESRVLVQTRRFTELGAASEKELPALDPVEKSPRDLPQNGE